MQFFVQKSIIECSTTSKHSRFRTVRFMHIISLPYRYSTEVFVTAVQILDRYVSRQSSLSKFKMSDANLTVGIVSLNLAAKLKQPIEPSLSSLARIIKADVKLLIQIESEILTTLGFELNFINMIDFIECYLYQLATPTNQHWLKKIKNYCLYLTKIICMDPRLNRLRQSELAQCTLIFAIYSYNRNQKVFDTFTESEIEVLLQQDLNLLFDTFAISNTVNDIGK